VSNTTAAIVWGSMMLVAIGFICLGLRRKPETEPAEED
jgi:hypothetical protein